MSQSLLSHTGKLLIVDDNFNQNIKDLITSLIESGLTVEYWDGKDKQHSKISNVRVLILDLDLSGGQIPKTNDSFYAMAVDVLHKIRGPYIVIIYAQEFDSEDVLKIKTMYETVYGPIDGFIDSISGYSKGVEPGKLIAKINEIINKKEIFQLILLWEKILDKAKDLGLSKFIRIQFEKEITAFVQSLTKDIGTQSLSREFISNMLRFVSRYTLRGEEFKTLSKILETLGKKDPIKTISDQLLQNRNMYFTPDKKDELWTGDIFKISSVPSPDTSTQSEINPSEPNYFKYKLLLTPECYFAQGSVDSFLVCNGFPLDFESLTNNNHPIYKIIPNFTLPNKSGMTPVQYQKKIEKPLNSLKKYHDRFYPLWNFSVTENKYIGICFDFQSINSISKEVFERMVSNHVSRLDSPSINSISKEVSERMALKRVSRLDSPYIVELMQDYARYSTRIGSLNINRAHIEPP